MAIAKPKNHARITAAPIKQDDGVLLRALNMRVNWRSVVSRTCRAQKLHELKLRITVTAYFTPKLGRSDLGVK